MRHVLHVTRVTLGPRAPRPHPEAPLARRTALVAFAFLAASALHLAARGLDLAELQRAFPLYALGGFGILIFGTTRLLIAGMAGRDVVGGAASSALTTMLAATGALATYALAHSGVAWLAVLPWSAAALAHVVVIALTVLRPPTRPAVEDPRRDARAKAPLRVLEAGGLAYLAYAAILLPQAYSGRAPLSVAIHVVLVGFVMVTIMGTAAQIFPRFARTRASPLLLALLVPFALLGPLLTAQGAATGRLLLRAGALTQGAAFLLFGILVASLLLPASHRRMHHVAYLAAPLAIGIGGLLALAYAFAPSYATYLAAHGILNVYGFAGLIVIAASTDLYGPALETGAVSAKRHGLVATTLTLFGLTAAAIGTVTEEVAGRLGMLVFAAGLVWQLVGILQTHRRAERVVSRLRAT